MLLRVPPARLTVGAGALSVVRSVVDGDAGQPGDVDGQPLPGDLGRVEARGASEEGPDLELLPGVNDQAGQVVEPPQLGDAHLVELGDLRQVVAADDGVPGEAGPLILAQAQPLPRIDAVAPEPVEGLQVRHRHAVGVGDLPQGVAALDDVHGRGRRPQTELLAGADQVSLDAVEMPQPVEVDLVGRGDLVEGLSGQHEVDALVVARGAQAQLLARPDAVPLQFVELAHQPQLQVEPQGDLRESVAGPHQVVFRRLGAVGNLPAQAEGLAGPDGVAGDSVQPAQPVARGAVGGGDLGQGVARPHHVAGGPGRASGWRTQAKPLAGQNAVPGEVVQPPELGSAEAVAAGQAGEGVPRPHDAGCRGGGDLQALSDGQGIG